MLLKIYIIITNYVLIEMPEERPRIFPSPSPHGISVHTSPRGCFLQDCE